MMMQHTFITQTAPSNVKSIQKRRSGPKFKSDDLISLIKEVSGTYDISTLRRLNLSRSNLRSIKSLIDCFHRMRGGDHALIELNLSHNSIRSIDSLASSSSSSAQHQHLTCLVQLKRLDLSYNLINEIPEGFMGTLGSPSSDQSDLESTSNSNDKKYSTNTSRTPIIKLHCLNLEGNLDLANVQSIHRLSTVSSTLTRLSFQKVVGIDACPLTRCTNYHEEVFQTLPNLQLLDYGSVVVTKAFLQVKKVAGEAIGADEVNDSDDTDGMIPMMKSDCPKTKEDSSKPEIRNDVTTIPHASISATSFHTTAKRNTRGGNIRDGDKGFTSSLMKPRLLKERCSTAPRSSIANTPTRTTRRPQSSTRNRKQLMRPY